MSEEIQSHEQQAGPQSIDGSIGPGVTATDASRLTPHASKSLISTGIQGLDRMLGGGLIPGSAVLVEGVPGAGKTTLGLQFLCHGAANGESRWTACWCCRWA